MLNVLGSDEYGYRYAGSAPIHIHYSPNKLQGLKRCFQNHASISHLSHMIFKWRRIEVRMTINYFLNFQSHVTLSLENFSIIRNKGILIFYLG